MRYGVPEHIFWDLNPRRLEPWQRMYEFQEQEKEDKEDRLLWLNGQYVMAAIAAVFDGKEAPYPEEPLSVTKQRDEQAEADKIAADKFMAFAMAFNAQFRKKHQSQPEK